MKQQLLKTMIVVLLLTSCTVGTATTTPTPLSDEMILNEFVGSYPLVDELGSVYRGLRIYQDGTFFFTFSLQPVILLVIVMVIGS